MEDLSPKDLLYHGSIHKTGNWEILAFWVVGQYLSKICYFFSFAVKVKVCSGQFIKQQHSWNRTYECLSFDLFITVPFHRFSQINNEIYNWICICWYMNELKLTCPLLECRSWLPLVVLVINANSLMSVSSDKLYMCFLQFLLSIIIVTDMYFWLLKPSCFVLPCLTGTPA